MEGTEESAEDTEVLWLGFDVGGEAGFLHGGLDLIGCGLGFYAGGS